MIENETPKKISPSQRKGIEALLTEGSLLAAAEAAGVTRGTLYRWLKDPAFTEALRAAEAEAIAALSRSLAGLGESAAAAFRDALDPGQKITVRLRAAEALTDRLLPWHVSGTWSDPIVRAAPLGLGAGPDTDH